MSQPTPSIEAIDVEQTLGQMIETLSNLITERGLEPACCVGIHTGGVWLAQRIAAALNLPEPAGELDASLYRDDYDRKGLQAGIRASTLPFSVADRHVILVDDVLMTGRTARAAINLLFDYGRPASICLATLLDTGGRELPLQADVAGAQISLHPGQRVKLEGPDPLRLSIVAQERGS